MRQGILTKITCKPFIFQTPTTEVEWLEIAKCFEVQWNFPNCIGALDGKRLRIVDPDNQKGFSNFVLLALVDGNYCFTHVDAAVVGDGSIWRDRKLREDIASGKLNIPPPKSWTNDYIDHPYVIIADDAFPLTDCLLKSYVHRKLTQEQLIYNYRLSRARRVVENALGIMASRFRVLHTTINRDPDFVTSMCLAIAALHNFLWIESGANYITPTSVDHEDPNYVVVEGEWREGDQLFPLAPNARKPQNAAKELRNDLAIYFNSPKGMVPWQENMIC